LLIHLLLDKEWSVREAAAGALRNLSAVGGENACESLVRDDVMTALSALLKECDLHMLTHSSWSQKNTESATTVLPTPTRSPSSSSLSSSLSSARRKGATEGGVAYKLLAVAEQGLHLLLNVCESSAVVGVAHQEEMVGLLLEFLAPQLFPPPIITTAAMCLYTLTEDNPPSHHILTSNPSHLTYLEDLLLTVSQEESHMLVVSTAVAGVLQHLLPSLPTHLASSAIEVLAEVLDKDIGPLLHTLTSTPPHTPPQTASASAATPSSSRLLTSQQSNHVVEQTENVLNAQLLALEIVANFCYIESEEGEEGESEWEDVEEEEVIGGEVEEEMSMEQDSQQPVQQLPAWLCEVLVEVGMVGKVWRKCCPPLTPSLSHPPPSQLSSIHTRWCAIQSRGFAALGNLLSALPRGALGDLEGGVLAVWQRVVELVVSGGVALSDDVTSLLVVLTKVMQNEEIQCVHIDHLQMLVAVCREKSATISQQVCADVVLIMATVGRRSLNLPLPIKTPLLQVVGKTLLDCVSCEPCEWVVARALDALYDVFGADECPIQVFSTLQIMPILEKASSQLHSRIAAKREGLGVHYGEVVCARDNLQPFIDYIHTRTKPHKCENRT
jgi:hypothetical protein